MNRFLKRIIPILLALSVIGCAVWYVWVYDRDFARDALLAQARYLDNSDRQDLATWFYDQAYIFADNDEDVAIELAEQYKSSGNYTKAEYTLTRAIANRASLKLYTALCKTYVEQDKLMDAVNMLDKISDPGIRAELEAVRPAAPTVSIAPGYYSEYIRLDFTAEDGSIYLCADGEFPSIHEDAYSGGMDLPQGETNIFAVTLGENGLVSSRGTYSYTIGGIIETVIFADPFIEEQVRADLGLDENAEILTKDLWNITSFSVPYWATDYSDLAGMIHLKDLTIYSAVTEELDVLSSLTELESLFITDCQPTKDHLTTIASLNHLTSLTLAQCDLSDISPLANAQRLEYLDLSYNSIGNISYICSLPNLKQLYLSHNALTDLTNLSGLKTLEIVDVSYNSLTSVSSVCNNLGLQKLYASNNLIYSIGPLNNLPDLKVVDLSKNTLTNVSVLGHCENLTEINISDNDLTDISTLSGLKNLRKLNCSNNSIKALPNWSKEVALVNLDASYNQISDLEPLRELPRLNILNMDYNPELSSVEPIVKCPVLLEVHLFGTKVIDVDELTFQSIIVHYNPTEVEVDITDPTESENAEDPENPENTEDPDSPTAPPVNQ